MEEFFTISFRRDLKLFQIINNLNKNEKEIIYSKDSNIKVLFKKIYFIFYTFLTELFVYLNK